MKKVLFLCTGNSCRSIMAEAALNHVGKDKFKAYSAGSRPTGEIHPTSLGTLERAGIDWSYLESKSLDEYENDEFDIVVTVCDKAKGEICPAYLKDAQKLHWSVPDPSHFDGSRHMIDAEFKRVFDVLVKNIEGHFLAN